jgi:hypothetical protein
MPWAWTDDLAKRLLEQEDGRPDDLADWLSRPTAVRVPDGADLLDVARDIASRATDETDM